MWLSSGEEIAGWIYIQQNTWALAGYSGISAVVSCAISLLEIESFLFSSYLMAVLLTCLSSKLYYFQEKLQLSF